MAGSCRCRYPGAVRRWGTAARRAALAVLVVLGVIAPLLMRAAWEGRAELRTADAWAHEGRADLEVVHLGRAARWRTPFAGHDEEALARLMAIGAAAEEDVEGRGSQTALLAYREVRSALLATRAWGLADEGTYAAANQRIAAMMAAQERLFETDLSGRGAAEEHHMELLERSGHSSSRWGVLAGLLAFVCGAAALGRGIPEEGPLRRGPLLAFAALAIIFGSLAWLLR